MSTWRNVPLGHVCERLIGFSLPIDDLVAVISYDGIHCFSLDAPSPITHDYDYAEGLPASDESDPEDDFTYRGAGYDYKRQRLDLDGKTYSILGLHGGIPLLQSDRGETLAVTKDERLVVRDRSGKELFSHGYDDLSGDWVIATFTPDSKYILLGVPYRLLIFSRVD